MKQMWAWEAQNFINKNVTSHDKQAQAKTLKVLPDSAHGLSQVEAFRIGLGPCRLLSWW
jgi:hypothetical protein